LTASEVSCHHIIFGSVSDTMSSSTPSAASHSEKPPLLAFYSIGDDDCKIPLATCVDCLLEVWKEVKQRFTEPCQLAMIRDFTTKQEQTLRINLQEAGLRVLPAETDLASLEPLVIAVGSIRALRQGGDRANIQLHRRLPELEGWTKTSFEGRTGEYGRAYRVETPSSKKYEVGASLDSVILVVAPNMNPQRAGYTSSIAPCSALLRNAYREMFGHFESVLNSKHAQNGFAEPSRKRLRAEGLKEGQSRDSTSVSSLVSSSAVVRGGDPKPLSIGVGTLPWGVVYPDPRKRPSTDDISKMLKEIVGATSITENEVVLIDTADTYCAGKEDPHYVENVIGDVLRRSSEIRSRIAIAAKYGMTRVNSESTGWRPRFDLSPECIRASLKKTLDALGAESVYLWQLHHADLVHKKSRSALFSILKEVARLVDEGKVRHVGLCNCTAEILRDVHKEMPGLIYSVQNEYSFWQKAPERKGVFEACRELNIAFIGYAPFGGLKARRGERTIEEAFPQLTTVAKSRNCSPGTVYLAYLLARGKRMGVERMMVIPSTRSLLRAQENMRTASMALTPSEMDQLDAGWR